ncbi:AMIN domain-containing protein [Lyngbya aestuarii]|uniref:AMIN domain-containing protein n=1 Tax=Lyngbya aestuarii TaxID=118322 RepID=UPI00403E0F77
MIAIVGEECTVRQAQNLSGIVMGGAVALLAVQPVWAATTQVTAVRLNPKGNGLELILETQAGGDRPQIFAVSRGNEWVADIVGTSLNLREGESFRQDNPIPGVTSVVVSPLDTNSIRVVVSGDGKPPSGRIIQGEGNFIALGISTTANNRTAANIPAPRPSAPTRESRRNSPEPLAQTPPAETAQPEVEPEVIPEPPAPTPEVLFPDPEITIDGQPANSAGPARPVAPAPPFLPRAVAPPVGDIAISSINAAATTIDLGTAARVPRLVLREAPVREVLALLARSAGLNLAFAGDGPPTQGQGAARGAAQGAPQDSALQRISLDLEDEPVQDVFNYVLQLSGLQANRVGRTIFVGAKLPDGARNIISRTLRLNQVSAVAAASFLSAQGAETQRPVTTEQVTIVGEGAAQRTVINETTNIEPLVAQQTESGAPLLLRGLSVVPDDRLNAISMIGTPRQVEIATSLLTQLDARRRQVAVNVKVVDVDLGATDQFNTSFSFGIGDFAVNSNPATDLNFPAALGNSGSIDINQNNDDQDFAATVNARIVNGNGKILTDPTLLVGEGQTAQINLTQEVIGNVERTREGTGENVTTTVTAEKVEVGLILNIQVDRIDDNGFITLAVNPEVSSIREDAALSTGGGDTNQISLRNIRRLTTGQVRLRDSQTLILAGIIQDEDRASVSKVPILGDLPIIGALFRNTTRTKARREVIVLVTPQILDDSVESAFGYNYAPSPEARQTLRRQNSPFLEGN